MSFFVIVLYLRKREGIVMSIGHVFGVAAVATLVLLGLKECGDIASGETAAQQKRNNATPIEEMRPQSQNRAPQQRDPCRDPYPNPQTLQEMCLETTTQTPSR